MLNDSFFPASFSPDSRRVLLTPGPFARRHLLYLQEAGQYRLLEAGHETRRENLSSHLLVSVHEGRGELFYEDRTFPLQAGSLFFIDCRKPHSYRSSREAPWALSWAHFDGCSARGYYALFRKRLEPAFESPRKERIDGLLAELLALNLRPGPETELQNARLLTDLVTLLAAGTAPEPPEEDGLLDKLRAYLIGHSAENPGLDELAERFHLSKYHLARAFKRRYGQTPAAFLLGQRLTRAKQLLRFTDRTVAQIAEDCGFHEPSYFNRQFKKVEGCTASEFRSRWRG